MQRERVRHTPQQTSPAAASRAPAMRDASVTRRHLSQRLHALRRPARTSMGLRRSRSSSSASMTRDMKGASSEATRAREDEEREEEEEAAPPPTAAAAAPPPPPPAPPPPPFAAASDDTVADDDEAASASIPFFNSLALPKVRPMFLSSSTVISTSTSLVMLSFLHTACESPAHVAQRNHLNTRTGACSVLRT